MRQITGLRTCAFLYWGLALLFLAASCDLQAATVNNWVSASSTSWNVSANWDQARVPNSTDIATFDPAKSNVSCDLDFTVNVAGINIVTGYLGTVTQNGGIAVTIGASGWTQAGGTFTGGNSAITLNGAFSLSGGTFTTGNQTITTGSSWTVSGGTLDATTNDSTVVFLGTLTITGSHTLDNVTLRNTSSGSDITITVASGTTLTVVGTLTFDNTGTANTVINTGTIAAQGNITVADTLQYGGTATILINGTGDQTFTGAGSSSAGNIPDVNINKSSGTLTLSSTIFTGNDWTWTAGTVDATTNNSTVVFAGNLTITGSHTLDNATFCNTGNGSDITITVASGTTLTVVGTLTFDSTGAANTIINTGTIAAQGNVTVADTRTYNGSMVLQFTGTANQTFTSNTGFAPTGTVTINKASGTVTLAANTSFNSAGQDLTITSGTLDLHGYNLTVNDVLTVSTSGIFQLYGSETLTAGTKTLSTGSTVKFTGDGDSAADTYTITSYFTGSYKNLTINSTDGATDIFQLGATLTVAGNLTNTAGTLDVTASNFAINLTGNWSNSGTFTSRSGTVTFNGVDQSISGTTSFHNLTKVESTNDSTNSTWTFPASTTTTVTNIWTVDGLDANDQILLVSSSPSTRWNISPNGTRTIDYATVTDSNNTSSTIINEFSDVTVTDGGNDIRWAFSTNQANTWLGETSSTWSTDSNWLDGSKPTSGQIAYFDGNVSSNNAATTSDPNVLGVDIDSVYTGTITQNSGVAITIGTSGWTQAGGTFTGGNSAIAFNGAFTLAGGIFNAGSQVITVDGNWTYTSGTLTPGSSTVKFIGYNGLTRTITGSQSLNNIAFYSIQNTVVFVINSGDTLTVDGSLSLGAADTRYVTVNTGTIAAKGDITTYGSLIGGTATLLINGSGTQTLTGNNGSLCNVNISSSGTLNLVGTIESQRNWTYTTGTIDPGTSTVTFQGQNSSVYTITGSHTLANVTFKSIQNAAIFTIALGTTLTATGTLTVGASLNTMINTGTLAVAGNMVVNSGAIGGTAALTFTGGSAQSYTNNGGTNVGG